jgi:lysophospholipase L1-like esterase
MSSPNQTFSRRHLLTGAAAAAGAGGLGVLLNACQLGERPRFDDTTGTGPIVATGGRPLSSVAVIGDSITVGSTVEIQFALAVAGITAPTIDAQVGRRIAVGDGVGAPLNGVSAVQALVGSGFAADVWVIALGTNDIGQYGADGYAPVVTQLLAALPTDVPVVWIDAHRPTQPEDTDLFNTGLQAALSGRANTLSKSWRALCDQPGVDLLQDDQIHPNQAGREAFGNLVTNAVRAAAQL